MLFGWAKAQHLLSRKLHLHPGRTIVSATDDRRNVAAVGWAAIPGGMSLSFAPCQDYHEYQVSETVESRP